MKVNIASEGSLGSLSGEAGHTRLPDFSPLVPEPYSREVKTPGWHRGENSVPFQVCSQGRYEERGVPTPLNPFP